MGDIFANCFFLWEPFSPRGVLSLWGGGGGFFFLRWACLGLPRPLERFLGGIFLHVVMCWLLLSIWRNFLGLPLGGHPPPPPQKKKIKNSAISGNRSFLRRACLIRTSLQVHCYNIIIIEKFNHFWKISREKVFFSKTPQNWYFLPDDQVINVHCIVNSKL